MRSTMYLILGLTTVLICSTVSADLSVNSPAPTFKAIDINGETVDIDSLLQEDPYLVILHFFSISESEEALALKLRYIHQRYEKIPVVALGLEEEADALKKFSEEMGIEYHVIDADTLKSASWLKDVDVLPMTLFIQADSEKTIDKVIKGGGSSKASILVKLAESLYRRGESDDAEAAAKEALTQGEDSEDAHETLGFIYIESGKLDEAEAEFGAIDSNAGLAMVKLEQGDADAAIQLADAAPGNSYAQTIKAKAQLNKGDIAGAEATISKAAALPAKDWQKSDAFTIQGRIAQENGNNKMAMAHYANAVAIDPANVKALSNEAAVHRTNGNLKEAETVLAKASAVSKNDQLSQLMMSQIQAELESANDIKRGELIRSQIQDLTKRFESMKASGEAASLDKWTTRPLVLALLPGASTSPVFFERAGTDIVIQRELERQLQANKGVSVVEREMLDKLLQELNLGSSELADSTTQRRLGQVLSAGMLGFIEFANVGGTPTMYLRLVDTETTSIAFQTSHEVNDRNLQTMINAASDALLAEVAGDRELKGLVADAADNDAIIINLGKKHGVKEGTEFAVLEEGDPIEVGGRIIAHRQRVVGTIIVTAVEDDYAICSTGDAKIKITKEMKIKVK